MTPWVLRLIVANVAMYFLQGLSPYVTYQLQLVPAEILQHPWTPITYMFLHDPSSPTHLLFNMIGLFFFGPRVESRLGGRHFLGLYFTSGITGAILSLLTPHFAIVGASGAIFGVMLAFAIYWPHDRIYIWGILPVEARWLIIIMTAMSLAGGMHITHSNLAHFAHLGGFAGGYLYLRWADLTSKTREFKVRATNPVARKLINSQTADLQRWARIPRDSMHEVNRSEVNRILDKISAQGIGSLTQGEREVLDRFSPQ
jgi:membrane associated rhomboid family serine protease